MPTPPRASRPRRRAGLVDRVVDGERVVLDTDKNLIHKLNPTASAIWDRCDGETEIGAICERVAAQFECRPEDVEDDVTALIEQLAELGVLEGVASDS